MGRTFTVEQANQMLPLVSRIVQDIVTHYADWQRVVGEFELKTEQADDPVSAASALRLQHEAQRLATQIERFIGELTDLGVEFKGFDQGLVDFPSTRHGQVIMLCWKLNEPAVAFWHEPAAGFAGRQPLLALS